MGSDEIFSGIENSCVDIINSYEKLAYGNSIECMEDVDNYIKYITYAIGYVAGVFSEDAYEEIKAQIIDSRAEILRLNETKSTFIDAPVVEDFGMVSEAEARNFNDIRLEFFELMKQIRNSGLNYDFYIPEINDKGLWEQEIDTMKEFINTEAI
jgi:hypothetical protein